MYNIRRKSDGMFMLGQSVHQKDFAQAILDQKYSNTKIEELNKRRWEFSKSPPMPLDDYELVETDKLWTF